MENIQGFIGLEYWKLFLLSVSIFLVGFSGRKIFEKITFPLLLIISSVAIGSVMAISAVGAWVGPVVAAALLGVSRVERSFSEGARWGAIFSAIAVGMLLPAWKYLFGFFPTEPCCGGLPFPSNHLLVTFLLAEGLLFAVLWKDAVRVSRSRAYRFPTLEMIGGVGGSAVTKIFSTITGAVSSFSAARVFGPAGPAATVSIFAGVMMGGVAAATLLSGSAIGAVLTRISGRGKISPVMFALGIMLFEVIVEGVKGLKTLKRVFLRNRMAKDVAESVGRDGKASEGKFLSRENLKLLAIAAIFVVVAYLSSRSDFLASTTAGGVFALLLVVGVGSYLLRVFAHSGMVHLGRGANVAAVTAAVFTEGRQRFLMDLSILAAFVGAGVLALAFAMRRLENAPAEKLHPNIQLGVGNFSGALLGFFSATAAVSAFFSGSSIAAGVASPRGVTRALLIKNLSSISLSRETVVPVITGALLAAFLKKRFRIGGTILAAGAIMPVKAVIWMAAGGVFRTVLGAERYKRILPSLVFLITGASIVPILLAVV